eukprot:PhM_4_TR4961/c0_g1_i1/m.27000
MTAPSATTASTFDDFHDEEDYPIMESLQSPTTREFLKFKQMLKERRDREELLERLQKTQEELVDLVVEGEKETHRSLYEEYKAEVREATTRSNHILEWAVKQEKEKKALENETAEERRERLGLGKRVGDEGSSKRRIQSMLEEQKKELAELEALQAKEKPKLEQMLKGTESWQYK